MSYLNEEIPLIAEVAKRAAARGDILGWGEALFPEKFTLPFCQELHGYFVDVAEEPFTSTLAPRGSAKTTLRCFLIPLFLALNYPEKYQFFLNVQSTATKATAVNISIKQEIEENQVLNLLYCDLVASNEKWTEKFIALKNGVCFGSVGAGESIRGMQSRNKRPDYIIVDDLYDDDDINNRQRIEKKSNWFWGSLYKAMAPDKKTCMHVQGTAIARYDLMHSLADKKGVLFKKFQAIKPDGTPLWHEHHTIESLEQEKELIGIHTFNREMQNDPRDDETAIIKTHWIKFYDCMPDPEIERVDRVICGVDPSIGAKETADYTGIAVVIRTRDKNGVYRYYIQDLYNQHISMHERVELLKSLHERYKFREVIVEAIAGFKDFCAELKRLTNLPVREVSRVSDKTTTLETKSYLFQNEKVFINNNLPDKLKNALIDQLTTNKPQHDDIRDAVLLCLETQRREPRALIA